MDAPFEWREGWEYTLPDGDARYHEAQRLEPRQIELIGLRGRDLGDREILDREARSSRTA